MSNTKFTPGPWGLVKKYSMGRYGIGKPGEDTQIAKVVWHALYDKEAAANANLMTAAPELYEALEKSIEQMLIGLTSVQKLIETHGRRNGLAEIEANMMLQIQESKAALAKARGEKTDKI